MAQEWSAHYRAEGVPPHPAQLLNNQDAPATTGRQAPDSWMTKE